MKSGPLRLYFVVGEESGDALGASLLSTLREMHPDIEANGLAGSRMQKLGVTSLFDISDISVMGISAVAARLPRLLSRIRQTANDIVHKKPDILILIDSPEFAYRIAKRVRKSSPDTKIIKYVAPSVWAWRPGRAKKIKPYIDHVLAILPFEPDEMERLGGPATTYVGHPLAADIPKITAKSRKQVASKPNLIVLPGSRKGEITRLMPVIGETLQILNDRGNAFTVTLPAVEQYEGLIREYSKDWAFQTTVVSGDEARHKAFREGDLALAASGTVTLELALYKLPTVAIYKLDGMAMRIRHLLTGWTASLPNLIADYPIVPEKFNEYSHPQYIARMLERLCVDDHERQQQLQGFELIIKRLKHTTPPHEKAAQIILEMSGR